MSTGATQSSAEALSISIAANFTIDPIEEFLGFWMKTLEMESDIRIAPYNQVFQQLLDGGLLRLNTSGVNLVCLDLEAWLTDEPLAIAQSKLDQAVGDLISMLQSPRGAGAGGCVLIFPADTHSERADVIESAKARIQTECGSIPGWSAIDVAQAAALYGVFQTRDAFAHKLAHIPFTELLYVAAATAAARWIRARTVKAKKVIVLDCDQTLWQGIHGEGTMQVTEPYRRLQEFMLRQRERGVLLTLASKNNEADVLEALDSGACVLRSEHCAAWQINWNPKSENLQTLSDELGLALNSFIFVDDNPLECMEVRNRCPEVMTIQLPAEARLIPAFLEHMWVFDRMAATDEDRNRAAMYAAERQRTELSKKALTQEEFLASLKIEIDFAPCSPADLARVAQLTQRTTQFNMSGKLQTEQSLSSLLTGGQYECWTVRVKDMFGDYGLVGVALFGVVQGALRLETFLMSCRALGRRVEHKIVEKVKQLALERNADRIVIPVVPTARNRPAREFLAGLCGVSADVQEPFECVLSVNQDESEWHPTEPIARVEAAASAKSAKRATDVDIQSVLARIATELQSAQSILAAARPGKSERPADAGVPVPATSSLEQALVDIWSEVLGIEPVGIRDNFFEMGGTSLSATRLLGLIHSRIGADMGLTSVLKAPTAETLAAEIGQISHKLSRAEQGSS